MADQFQGKRIPWPQYEEFKQLHQASILTYVQQYEIQHMDKPEFESKLPRSFYQIHKLITKMLKDNNIVSSQQDENTNQLQKVVKSVMKIQTTVIQQNLKSQKDIQGILESMKPEIAELLGPQIQQEISKGFLENISGIAELIEAKFTQLEHNSQQQHDTVINAISIDKTNRLIQLEIELKAKDAQIIELHSKESELKGKLKGRDEVSEALNHKFEQLQIQLDSLSSAKDIRVDQLQIILKEKDETIATLKLQVLDAQATHQAQINQSERINQELAAKDDQIKTLIQKETELRQEVKGKDDAIGALNQKIEILQHQNEALRSEKDASFNQLERLLKEKDDNASFYNKLQLQVQDAQAAHQDQNKQLERINYELTAKDDEIKTLRQCKNELNEKLEGKDSTIDKLVRNIQSAQHKFDVLSNEKKVTLKEIEGQLQEKQAIAKINEELQNQFSNAQDQLLSYQDKINEFQRINNDLTAKNSELDTQIQSFIEIAAKKMQQQTVAQTQEIIQLSKPNPSALKYLVSLIDQFLLNSKCATEIQQKLYLIQLLGNKKLVTVLLYRGSIHGWKALDFHNRCDQKGPTICLFQVKDGDCIGGYTTAQWKSSGGKYLGDIDAMLFNLTCFRQFPSKRSCQDIFCDKLYGPDFSGNSKELAAYNEPFNGDRNCCSRANDYGYLIPVEGGVNMLTNKKDGKFTISELEVWEVSGYMDEKDQFVKYDIEEVNRIRQEKLKKQQQCKNQ